MPSREKQKGNALCSASSGRADNGSLTIQTILNIIAEKAIAANLSRKASDALQTLTRKLLLSYKLHVSQESLILSIQFNCTALTYYNTNYVMVGKEKGRS